MTDRQLRQTENTELQHLINSIIHIISTPFSIFNSNSTCRREYVGYCSHSLSHSLRLFNFLSVLMILGDVTDYLLLIAICQISNAGRGTYYNSE